MILVLCAHYTSSASVMPKSGAKEFANLANDMLSHLKNRIGGQHDVLDAR